MRGEVVSKKWTPAQTKVITAGTDKNLLVPASAGSGKTSVMIERIATMIETGAPWDVILVMTFTNESARDMKEKLGRRLGAKYQQIIGQIAIGTFHKFCENLVQSHFSTAMVNPQFAILDEDNARAMQNETLDKLIEDWGPGGHPLVDNFCTPTGCQGLKDIILNTAKFLEWQSSDWLETTALAGYTEDMQKNIAHQIIVNHYRDAGAYYVDKFPPDMDCHAWAKRLAGVQSYDDLHNIATTFTGLKRMSRDSEYYTAKDGLNEILRDKICKQYILSPEQILKNQAADRTLVTQVIEFLHQYTAAYRATKDTRNFLDFADLERRATEILQHNDIRARTQEKYKYIFVDEYQDTNPVQEQILQLVAGKNPVFAVGDIKQSIYAFRGTSSAAFTDRLKTSNVVYLNQNFRSNGGILRFVNQVFSRTMRTGTALLDYENTSRFEIPNGTTDAVSVTVIENGDAEHEARYITAQIGELLANGTQPQDIAILARERKNFDTLTRTLNSVGIRCMADKRAHTDELYEISLLNNMLLACNDLTYELPRVLVEQSFVGDFDRKKYHELCKTHSVVDVLQTFITEHNIINMLLVTPDGEARVRNIYTFLNKLRGATYADTVAQYTHMLLHGQLDIQIPVSPAGNCVKLMTIHSAKGLEFPIVFLYGAGEIFSSADKRKSIMLDKTLGMCVFSTNPDDNKKHMSLARLGSSIASTKSQIAEEMRLLYVALTRAKDRLFIVGSGHGYEPTIQSDFEILGARNYLDFIRPTDTISIDDVPAPAPPKQQRVLTAKPNPAIVKQLRARFDAVGNYKFKAATDMPIKSSVTSLTKAEEEYVETLPKRSPFDKDRGTEYGTRFHTAMQTGEYFDDATRKCAQIIDDFTRGMTTHREIVVFQNVEIYGEQILVQGVIDLLATGNGRAFIVDYKTTHANEARLRELYCGQLEMYAAAVTKATGLDVKSYIYSSVLHRIIEI